jgi:hypothetical protein
VQKTIFPDSNESYKLFVSNLNNKLITGSNGQYRRKPTFLSAMIAESLPGKAVNYNINTLKAELKSNLYSIPSSRSGLLAFNSNTLHKVIKEGRALRKAKGISLEMAYTTIAEMYALPDPEQIVLACRVPVPDDEFHRIILGQMILSLCVGKKSNPDNKRDLYIAGYRQPSRCKHSTKDLVLGGVSFGDVLMLALPQAFGNSKKTTDFSSYYICKYSAGEARIPLLDIGENQVKQLAQHLCIEFSGQDYEWLSSGGPFTRITESQLFVHLQEWALRHPQKARNASSPYFEDWGNLALQLPLRDFDI